MAMDMDQEDMIFKAPHYMVASYVYITDPCFLFEISD